MIVEKGEIFDILGPNGAGKTTTLNIITADLHPDKGQVGIQKLFIFFISIKAISILRSKSVLKISIFQALAQADKIT